MLRCNVGILFDIENVTEVASASEVHFNVFFFFFFFFGFVFVFVFFFTKCQRPNIVKIIQGKFHALALIWLILNIPDSPSQIIHLKNILRLDYP